MYVLCIASFCIIFYIEYDDTWHEYVMKENNYRTHGE